MENLASLLITWYEDNFRALPWRTNYEAYHVFISELMLQQTQMERGIVYFNRWIQLFPTLFDVAKASEEEILHAWEGLGYYRRARYIHAFAKEVCAKHNGIIPQEQEILKNFKGIGDYTLAALCGIAFNQDIVTIDANVERVFSRLFCISGDTKKKPAKDMIKHYAYSFLPKGKARLYNQALMELGALVCKKNPDCSNCPLTQNCQAFKESKQNEFPQLKQKQKLLYEDWLQLIFLSKNANIALTQREKNLHWGGLFEFYSFMPSSKEYNHCLKSELESLSIQAQKITKFEKIDYSYTNHRNSVVFYTIETNLEDELLINKLSSKQHSFFCIEEDKIKHHALPSPYRKAIKKIFPHI